MRRLPQIVGISGAALLALTACSEDADEATEASEEGQEATEERSYESAEDLGPESAQAFLSNSVVALDEGEYGPVDVVNSGLAHDYLGADCEDRGENSYTCTVIGPHQVSVEQEVEVTFTDAEVGHINVDVEAGETISIYGTTENEFASEGVFYRDNHHDGAFLYEDVPLSVFEEAAGDSSGFSVEDVETRIAQDEDQPREASCPEELPGNIGSYIVCEITDASADSDESNVIVTVVAEDEMQTRISGDYHEPGDPNLDEPDGDPADPSNWEDEDSSAEEIDEDGEDEGW